jgi:hypothetical protein
LGVIGAVAYFRFLNRKKPVRSVASSSEANAIIGPASLLAALALFPLDYVDRADAAPVSMAVFIVMLMTTAFSLLLEFGMYRAGRTPPFWRSTRLQTEKRLVGKSWQLIIVLLLFVLVFQMAFIALDIWPPSGKKSMSAIARMGEMLAGDFDYNFGIGWIAGGTCGLLIFCSIYTAVHAINMSKQQRG